MAAKIKKIPSENDGIFKSVEEMFGGKTAEEELVANWVVKHKGNFTNRKLTDKEEKFAKRMLKSSYHNVKEGLNKNDSFGKFLKFLGSAFRNMTTAIERDAYFNEFKIFSLFKTMPKNAVEM